MSSLTTISHKLAKYKKHQMQKHHTHKKQTSYWFQTNTKTWKSVQRNNRKIWVVHGCEWWFWGKYAFL